MQQCVANASLDVLIAEAVESVLRASPALAEIRAAGLGVQVSSDTDGFVAELVAPRARGFPVLRARVSRGELAYRSASEPAASIAARLGAELSRGWNRWVAEGERATHMVVG